MRNLDAKSRQVATHRSARLAAVATPIVIAGASLALLFNPWWVFPAQQRAGVAALTGYSDADVARITGSLIGDVTLGPPDFAVTDQGRPVLDDAERGHMRDVFGVLRAFDLIVALAALALVTLGIRCRGEGSWWRAVGRAALAMAVVGTSVGILFAAFFDAAWLAFHEIFFPGGNYLFDSRSERLTQLFPTAFWMDAATTVFIVGVSMSLAVWTGARYIASRIEGHPD